MNSRAELSRRFIVPLALACLVFCPFARPAAAQSQKRVLVLYSFRQDARGGSTIEAVYRRVLNNALGDSVGYFSEYLDSTRFEEGTYRAAVREYLRSQYANQHFDLVIATNTPVFDFITRAKLFPDSPVVFNVNRKTRAGSNSTGTIAIPDFRSTITSALHAQPNVRNVFVVSGASEFDQANEALFRTQCEDLAGLVELTYLTDLSVQALESRVSQLPRDSMIYYLTVSLDATGRRFLSLDVLDRLSAVANAPIYSWVDVALGHGVVGGLLRDSPQVARETAQVALRVLGGESPAAIPVGDLDTNAYRFDERQLRRWQISEARLPAGSTILFREGSFLSRHPGYVLIAIGLIGAQAALVAGILIQRARRRSKATVQHLESRQSAILSAIPDLMFVHLRDGTYVDYHARDPTLLFVPPQEFIGRKIRDIMPPDLAAKFMNAIELTRPGGDPVVVDYELPMNPKRYFEARLVCDEKDRVLSMVRDVTDSKKAAEVNRDLVGRLIASQEVERQRIARELHDDVSQRIALLKFEMDQIIAGMKAGERRTTLQGLSTLAGEIASDVHNMSHELHPSRLRTLGLVSAIELLCRDVSQHRGVNVVFDRDTIPSQLDPNLSLCLYRIAQEGLHNIVRHSKAREAIVKLTCDEINACLYIADPGVGFDTRDARPLGLGLVGIRERVGLLRGQLAIYSSPGRGTRIGVRIPLESPVHDSSSPTSISA